MDITPLLWVQSNYLSRPKATVVEQRDQSMLTIIRQQPLHLLPELLRRLQRE